MGFSSLSSKVVCDDLIKDLKEEGKIPIMLTCFFKPTYTVKGL